MDSKDNYMSSKNKMIFLVIYFCALICIPFFIKRNYGQYINYNINLYINLIIYLILFIISICSFRDILRDNWGDIINNKKLFCSNMFFCFKVEIFAMFLQVVMAILISKVAPTNTNQNLCNQNLTNDILITVIIAVFLAPFVEELVFKYIIFKSISKKYKIGAYLITGLCFGMLHCLHGLLSGDFAQLMLIFVYFIPAVIECYVYKKTDNIFYLLIMHMIWNAVAIMTRL